MLSDVLIGNKTGFAVRLAGEPPQDRAIVDVQHPFDVVLFGVVQRLGARLIDAIAGEMGASDQQGFAGGDKRFADVFGPQRHVGAIFTVEDQGKGFPILETEQHHGGQSLRIDLNAADIATFTGQGFNQETPHVIVAGPAQHRRPEPQPGGAERDVGGRAAEVFGEAAHILQPCPDLLRIEVDAKAPEANQIQLTSTGKTSLAHAGSCYFYQPAPNAVTAPGTLGGCRLKRAGSNNQ